MQPTPAGKTACGSRSTGANSAAGGTNCREIRPPGLQKSIILLGFRDGTALADQQA